MNTALLSILAGLGGMFGWGTSDFFANTTSDKIGHTKAFFWSQIVGISLILLLVTFLKPSFALSPLLLGLTLFGGIAYAFGYLLFYKGFEIGNVSVVSAVINLQTLFIIFISFFRGQRLSPFQLLGVVLLLIGVLFVSVNFRELQKGTVSLLTGVKETFLSAIMFGVFYWPVNEFVVEQANWLSVGLLTKVTAVTVVAGLSLLIQKKTLFFDRTVKYIFPLLFSIGALEAVGALSAIYGQSYGDGILVAPISSALTVVTIGMAMVFLKEKISRIQGVGILMVITGIVLSAF